MKNRFTFENEWFAKKLKELQQNYQYPMCNNYPLSQRPENWDSMLHS